MDAGGCNARRKYDILFHGQFGGKFMELKTPLYDEHVKCGGRIVPFAGYLLPVQYPTGVITEHMAVREKCGLFDVSHMGEVIFEGPDALKNLNKIVTNDYTKMEAGRVRYGLMCYEDGGCVDDLLVYKLRDDKYFVVVNAGNRVKDVEWIKAHLEGDVKFTDISDTIAQLALQGPKAPEILKKVTSELPEKYYSFIADCEVAGVKGAIISRTGYTGSEGYEIYVAAEDGAKLWQALLEAGKEYGLIPCGLGARDTLRLEASMPLYGHEMNETITPFEAGLGFGVKMAKSDFIGRAALEKAGEPKRERIGLEVTGRGIVREHQDIFIGDRKIGHTTSGTHCPFVGKPLAMALVEKGALPLDAVAEVDVRGRRVAVKCVSMPFYKKG